jgi:hypothetical protein
MPSGGEVNVNVDPMEPIAALAPLSTTPSTSPSTIYSGSLPCVDAGLPETLHYLEHRCEVDMTHLLDDGRDGDEQYGIGCPGWVASVGVFMKSEG